MLFRNQSTVQSIQSVNSQAFIQINAIGSIGQPTQSVAINTMYYDIGIDANIVQPQQSLSSIGIVSLSSQVSVNLGSAVHDRKCKQCSNYITITSCGYDP